VILAVGEAVDRDFCRASGLSIHENGTLDYNRYTLETSRERFYAGGDLISGASNVSNAMGYGKKAARFIDQRLMEDVRTQEFLTHFEYDQTPPEHVSESPRHHPHPLPPKQRVKDFQESVLSLTAEEAVEEASRCLRCDIRENGLAVSHR
jgi:NADH-quinone oxidoreductase subunit F